jgi:hypothetical protein
MPVWGVQSFQAAWWASNPTAISDAGHIYQAVVGSPPGSVQTNPSLGVATAIGTDGPSVLRIQVQQGRVDLFESPSPQAMTAFPLFSDFQPAMQRFRQRLAPVTAAVGDSVRLAMVANISEVAASANDATDLLLSKLGISLPFNGGEEFIFQINRRLPLASMTGHEMNRIMKWLVESIQQITMTSGTPIVQSSFLATLSVDVNLVAATRAFTPAEQLSIFQEIGDKAERLCRANALSALS